MFTVVECVLYQHSRPIVVLAAAISLSGALAFFFLLARSDECDDRRRRFWVGVAASVGGLCVWATHFVAMLAYRGTVPLAFDPALTALSAAIAVLGFRLAVASARGPGAAAARSGAVATAAIAAMHFTGMEAVEAAAAIRYEAAPIGVGFLVAAVAMSASFQRFEAPAARRRILEAGLLMVLAICILHFTAVSATRLIPDPALPPVGDGVSDRAWLIGAISVVACAGIGLTIVAVLLDRYLTDTKGFADATLEGLAIVRDGRIVETNRRFALLLQAADTELVGRDPDDCIAAADGRPVATPRSAEVEAAPLLGDRDRIFQLAVHTIEYRARPCQVIAVQDLTERKSAERQISHLASHDALTDLANRVLLRERLSAALADATASNGSVALLALDLDRFKTVNDLFGHHQGDRVLVKVADLLRRCVSATDTVARVGGDEFVIVQVRQPQPEAAKALSARIRAAFESEMNMALDPTAVGVSIGVAVYPVDAADAEALARAADVALYEAKSAGRGTASFYDEGMEQAERDRRLLERDLRRAIAARQLSLVYQPLVDARGSPTGYEALLRWSHPERGLVPPDVFIPIAEETGLITAIGEWVLRQACAAAAEWNPDHYVSVNVSPAQLRWASFVDVVTEALSTSGLPPRRLALEITEAALLHDRAAALNVLESLNRLGVGVLMDDFGTGYSSLSNLQDFPFSKIKIDRSFVAAMPTDAGAKAIVRAIIGLGRSLDLPVVAEGVETREQFQMLIAEGCTEAQGYLFGLPAPESEMGLAPSLERYVARGSRRRSASAVGLPG